MNLDEYIFKCWCKGLKTRDIIEGWSGELTEKDVCDKFKFVLENYFNEQPN